MNAPAPAFLQDATPAQLEEAVAWNHRESFIVHAQAAQGEVQQAEGVTWTYAGPRGEATILFPRLTETKAGKTLDAIVRYYLDRRPEKLVGCWSLDPPQPLDLDVRLLARGFQTGWQPCWMALDFQRMRTDHPRPDGLKVALVEGDSVWDVEDLPYYDCEAATRRGSSADRRAQNSWRFAAWLEGKAVGHSSLFLTTGPLGVAGIYGVGVVPQARNRGIGKAVTLAACLHAQAMGCRHALLNATGERMYNQIGFERIGSGWTWWLNVARLAERPPTPERVALAEAVGRGDLETLASLGKRGTLQNLDAPLSNEMTLLQLAVHAGRHASAEWLVAQGATLDVISAWDMGWKERVPSLLAANPALANLRLGEMQATPLHTAVERNDIELARIVLAAHPDLEIEDSTFHSTPLGWARHLQRTEIIELIEQYQAHRAKESGSGL